MTAVALELRRVRPWELQVGDEVTIAVPLPSEDGYRHVVADVQDAGDGCVRVWYEVYSADGEQRASALGGEVTLLGETGRGCYQWDRLYGVWCPAHTEWLEVVA